MFINSLYLFIFFLINTFIDHKFMYYNANTIPKKQLCPV